MVSVRADAGQGQISGTVVDANGQPLADERVELRRPRKQGPGRLVVRTDAGGGFAYKRLPPARYEVEWVSDGRTVARRGPIELSVEQREVTDVTLVRPVPLPQDVGPGVARSFEQLQLLVQPGDSVALVETGGAQFNGRITDLSPPMLSLLEGESRREFREGYVATVRHRRGDPLGNGALAGFGFGASMGALATLAACRTVDCSGSWAAVPLVIGLYGAMGAGVGVAIDAAARHEQIIYYRRPTRTPAGITLAPLLGRDRVGVSARVGF